MNKDLKKILVYLYDNFSKTESDVKIINGKIIVEFLEHRIDSSKEVVDNYIKENNIKVSEYLTILDRRFAKRYNNGNTPILVYPKGWKPIKENIS